MEDKIPIFLQLRLRHITACSALLLSVVEYLTCSLFNIKIWSHVWVYKKKKLIKNKTLHLTLFRYFYTSQQQMSIKCRVAAVKSCPVLHFSGVIFFWFFGIIDTSTNKCWELSTAQAGARGREGCCTYSLSLMYRLNQTESAIFM
jgi:hypothetical protein